MTPPDPRARLDVEFEAAGGVVLRGWLYLPPMGDGPWPGVVMNHGFSATRHMALPAFAEVFAAAGLAVLLYDHRNLGDSGGEPRGLIDPWPQMLDARTAISWLATRPEVDAERLGLWGSSFSGGEAICVAAVDRRVRAVVANVPFAGLGLIDPEGATDRGVTFAAITDVLDGRRPVPTDPPMGPMPVVREPGSATPGFLDQPESAEWFLAAGGPGTGWANEVTVRFSADPPFDPGACIERLAPTPLLMVVAADDRVAAADMALSAFAVASEPKQLEIIPGHHFSAYDGPGFAVAARAATEFLRRHL